MRTLATHLNEHQVAAVLFDLDDTIIRREIAMKKWAASFAQATFSPEDEEEFRDLVALMIELDADGRGSKTAMFIEVKKRAPWLREDAETLSDMFREQLLTHMVLDRDAELLLDALSAAGLPFGIVTNGSTYQLAKIQQLGLDQRTACVFVSEVFGCKKPDPAIFLAAASSLNTISQSILFIGDDPTSDIVGASNVGMKTAWLHRDREWPIGDVKPDLIVGSLGELLEPVASPQKETFSK